jgi:putative two-component system response regulator
VVEIAAGQQATPYQKNEATLPPIVDIESAAEGHPVEAVPAE